MTDSAAARSRIGAIDFQASKNLFDLMTTLAQGILANLEKLPPELRTAATAWRLPWFAARWLKIRTKKAGPAVPFAFNWVQMDFTRRLLANNRLEEDRARGLHRFRGIRANVLKPRQLGFSTFIAALFFCDGIMNPGRTTVVCTHLQKMSLELIKTYRLFWACLPPEIKAGLTLEVDSKYEFAVAFPPGPNGEMLTPSRWIIWTEKGEEWRGGVIHNLHGSEAAFYSDYLGWKTAFFQAVDPETGNIILETTANGMNAYYDDVQACLREESSFDLVFYPWHVQPEYRRPWNPEKEPPITSEEQEGIDLYGWDLEQLAWRRWKIREIGSEERFHQEFPATVDEAFLTTGRPFFPMVDVKAALARAMAHPAPSTNPRPHVQVYEMPIKGELYLATGDVAEGIGEGDEVPGQPERGGADYCAGYIVKVRTLQVVATVHARMSPVEFARTMDWLGRQYRACLAPERNNHGHTVVHVLEQAQYPWLYRHLEYDSSGKETFLRAGFPTDPKTRPQILDALWQAIKANLLVCPDAGLWREATTFHRNSKTGKPEALSGYHDDRIIALAINIYLCTLGTTAWSAPTGAWADASGMPVASNEIPIQAPAPLPPEEEPAVVPLVAQLPQLAAVAVAVRPGTCGSCRFCEGGCCLVDVPSGGLKIRVNENDPGCMAHAARPREHASDLWKSAGPSLGE